jgi:SAM-dependent methyltransferase
MTGHSDARKWDARYRERPPGGEIPARVLLENRHLLPASGNALDLACGRGANALLLAEWGFSVVAWDISKIAIEQLRAEAARRKLRIDARVRDVVAQPPSAASFDIIVVSRFLHRALSPAIAAALRPWGLLFYQTFTAEKVSANGPNNPEYLLQPNELLALFRELRVIVYREEGCIGNTTQGLRNEAMLVAQKISSGD